MRSYIIIPVEMEVTRIRELTPNLVYGVAPWNFGRNGSYPNKGIDTIISNMHPAMIIM